MYQLAAVDMDGTLLTSDKKILPETMAAMQRALSEGKSIALCTGRPLAELKPYASLLSLVPSAVLESGALVYDLKNNKVLARHTIPAQVVSKVLPVIEKEDIMPHVMMHSLSYINAADLERMDHYLLGVYSPLYHEAATLVGSVTDLVKENMDDMEKILLHHADKEACVRTHDRLAGLSAEMVYAETASLEISPQNVTKGTGLKELAECLNLDLDQIIAIGDADNDIPALKTAGLGIAMQNANESVKSIADVITGDNNHDGCGDTIRKYLLNENR